MESKNKILEIHAKWLHDNGYYKEFMDCVHQAKTYNAYEDVRQIRARQRHETKQTIRLS
jgi:hypothetical protein